MIESGTAAVTHHNLNEQHVQQLRRFVTEEAVIAGCSELKILQRLRATTTSVLRQANQGQQPSAWTELSDLAANEMSG
jgi:hypothetical protein